MRRGDVVRPATRVITMRLPEVEWTALMTAARARHMSIGALVREHLEGPRLDVAPLQDLVFVAGRRAANDRLTDAERRELAELAAALAEILAGRQVRSSVAQLLAAPAAASDAGPLASEA